jgi:DNA invertase Pin-like site-specific DNA recombinase
MEGKTMIYGYARVSTKGQTDGNSLEEQEQKLTQAGATKIIRECFTGTKMGRPLFSQLIEELVEGDTLIVCKLDRFARNANEGAMLVQQLVNRGITVNILNMGIANATPMGKLMLNIMFAFAEYERDMIVERTQGGKEIARKRADFHEGRPKKFGPEQVKLALSLLENNSYTQVERMTGISKSTLIRASRELKVKAYG